MDNFWFWLSVIGSCTGIAGFLLALFIFVTDIKSLPELGAWLSGQKQSNGQVDVRSNRSWGDNEYIYPVIVGALVGAIIGGYDRELVEDIANLAVVLVAGETDRVVIGETGRMIGGIIYGVISGSFGGIIGARDRFGILGIVFGAIGGVFGGVFVGWLYGMIARSILEAVFGAIFGTFGGAIAGGFGGAIGGVFGLLFGIVLCASFGGLVGGNGD